MLFIHYFCAWLQGPCAGNSPHVHPRGSEISFLLYGNITFGMIEENANSNNPVIVNMTAGDTVHVPQGKWGCAPYFACKQARGVKVHFCFAGLLHFSKNDQCEPAAFLANFGTSDPGTQTIWNSFLRIPTSIINAATGLSEAAVEQLKMLPLVTPPGL